MEQFKLQKMKNITLIQVQAIDMSTQINLSDAKQCTVLL